MPYEMKCDGDSCYVYKQGSDKPKNKAAMSKDQAKKYMAALYANTEGGKKDLSDLEYAVIEEKCYSDSYAPYVDKMSQDQANYDPMGGVKGGGDSACATCRWFIPGSDSCYVVHGPIVPTGLSDMYMPQPPPYKPEPLEVVIVKPGETGGKADPDIDYSKAAQMTGIAKQIKATVQSFPMQPGGNGLPELELESGFKVLDNGRWVGWWTNNAQDRAGEWFSLKAIDDFIGRVDSKAVPYPELWHEHLPIPVGRADSLARIGYLGFATGTFYDTPTGQAGRKSYESDIAAGKKKTMSHQYLYPKSMKRDGVYHAFNSFELSVLDAGKEANPITYFGVKAVMKIVLDAKKRAELLERFGNDNEYVNKLLDFGGVVSKAMESAGLDLKALEALPDVMEFEVTDSAAQAAVKELGEATLAGIKAITAEIKTLATKVEAVESAQKTELAAAQQAVSDLKSFVEKEMGYTPRASKSAQTKVPASNAQVQHLKQQNAAAGKKAQDDPIADLEANADEAGNGRRSIFEEIVAAGKLNR